MNTTPIRHANSPDSPTPFGWIGRLADARSPREVAEVIVQLPQAEPGCKAATVFWDLAWVANPGANRSRRWAMAILNWSIRQRRAACERFHRIAAFWRFRCSKPICPRPTWPSLLIAMDAPPTDAHGRATVAGGRIPEAAQRFLDSTTTLLHVTGRHLFRALESAHLRDSLAGLERSELLQRSPFAISDLAECSRASTRSSTR